MLGSDCIAKAGGALGGILPIGPAPTNPVPPNGGIPAQEGGSTTRPSGLRGCLPAAG